MRVFGAAAVSLANVVHLIGGLLYDHDAEDSSEQPHQGIYRFDGGGEGSWSLVGNMTTTRYYHAATSVLRSDFSQFCQ